ncbi:hypothetical protein TGRUB_276840 [Toxoplasma gondii RUB]|uniref:Uncharacterized protein n=10 Tax=Toxoplasma gondii TaxID=5811 RepID=S7UZT2_TOXGG|nr:hypothetical protein TGGT1_276840 [Toxoplasma gondii GT1]KAF4639039.1 hypothetical protein TGRH88_066480 [Toxoplasma gondii]KFG27997.1 hypothetical protein TGP89_276840 [Toxoplasma gondii p89]KFG33174.1 hypothetical protein TGFOU_276840 [Toxoplasma gondii FOU]KFG34201.1 hypothetical protein TGDOM2_276840 [Toxoplasma gondii GAB2-2007-GAL-DOM2]KFG56867.1 hypothetical protein TGRUB_276840 [Toxoplasma gondii RUB]KFG99436.1 hypothetical protein TGVAND_276840 [Toxoplasma gondii VAND]KFH02224.1 
MVEKNFNSSSVDISRTGVSDNGVSQLCQAISQRSSLQALALPIVGHDGLRSIALMLESRGSTALQKLSVQVDNRTTLSPVNPTDEADFLLEQLSEEIQKSKTASKKKLESQVENGVQAGDEEGGSAETDRVQGSGAHGGADEDSSVGDNEAYQQSLLEREHLRGYGDTSSSQVTPPM